jgi:hypothetical protein
MVCNQTIDPAPTRVIARHMDDRAAHYRRAADNAARAAHEGDPQDRHAGLRFAEQLAGRAASLERAPKPTAIPIKVAK